MCILRHGETFNVEGFVEGKNSRGRPRVECNMCATRIIMGVILTKKLNREEWRTAINQSQD